ncbi:S46 family peptidase [Flavihumibacter stibioxidans]|uniref:Dipeptidyl-peptidase n=1 Tax=Flavihumibacter stibioxidans TaxID=1834163 RepID=A0ABR7MAN4_9BACT|nr:S46 family peptidase [Flavihumibacter stibioxidans]MBC6491785.1 peptidase S46 [Flavihumibacter stibioxidans]
MKKIFASIALLVTTLRGLADEGMWLPMLLGKQVYADMVKKGLKLSPDQLYSINKASIKDAIVIFGRGCTGEIVSSQGLIFTNHHCGYDVIAGASTMQHNYLKDGFYAKTKQEEIPAPGLSVQFLLKIEDVTRRIDSLLAGSSGAERANRQSELIAQINAEYSDVSKNIEARISPVFKGNQFLVFVYQRYNDIRLVGTPPESIGKYGGDTDNWEWPRHTGDFSVFRVYTNKLNQPAGYSPENQPMKPKHFLPVSIRGVKEGDFAMIFGYPGGTNRYETSYGVKLKTETENPSLVELRDIRLKYMLEEMKKDPAVKLKLASDFAGIANYWKFYDGESKQLLKYKIYEKKLQEEAAFRQWAKGKPEFENIFSDWQKAYTAWSPFAKHRVYINEGILGSPLAAFAASLMNVERLAVSTGAKAGDLQKAVEDASERRQEFLKAADLASDEKILAATARMFYTNIDRNQHPIGFFEGLKANYGDLKEEGSWRKWAADVFRNTAILNDAKWESFKKAPASIQEDPAFAYVSAFIKNFTSKYLPFFQQFTTQNNELGRMYLKGVMQMNPKKVMYPDATFTMRTSYGNVKSYRPRDEVNYHFVTTMKGVMEKYKAGDYEFDLPAKLMELAARKDYGQYIDKQRNDLVVGFITTNDITGGNSGSPVIDGSGNLIGLAFDGNYEALSHKLAFDKDLNRTICVDVRYVLWCIDKLGGARHIVDELKLVR